MKLSSEIIFVLYIFVMGLMLGLILPKIFKNFSLRIVSFRKIGNKFKEVKSKFFRKKLCHCGLTKTPPYCDNSHPFAFRCFRWWRWINNNLDERDKGL